MRKRVIICSVLALAAVLIISICLIVHHNSITPKHGDLVVNGEIVCQNDIDIYKNNVAHIPLVKVMQAMGFDIQWENDNVANINGYGKTLVLNVSQMSLIDADSSHNLITPAPGSRNFYCQTASKDIVIDDNTVKSIMTLLEIDIRIDVNLSQAAVYIYTTGNNP